MAFVNIPDAQFQVRNVQTSHQAGITVTFASSRLQSLFIHQRRSIWTSVLSFIISEIFANTTHGKHYYVCSFDINERLRNFTVVISIASKIFYRIVLFANIDLWHHINFQVFHLLSNDALTFNARARFFSSCSAPAVDLLVSVKYCFTILACFKYIDI